MIITHKTKDKQIRTYFIYLAIVGKLSCLLLLLPHQQQHQQEEVLLRDKLKKDIFEVNIEQNLL
jgi:hypothetical protein